MKYIAIDVLIDKNKCYILNFLDTRDEYIRLFITLTKNKDILIKSFGIVRYMHLLFDLINADYSYFKDDNYLSFLFYSVDFISLLCKKNLTYSFHKNEFAQEYIANIPQSMIKDINDFINKYKYYIVAVESFTVIYFRLYRYVPFCLYFYALDYRNSVNKRLKSRNASNEFIDIVNKRFDEVEVWSKQDKSKEITMFINRIVKAHNLEEKIK